MKSTNSGARRNESGPHLDALIAELAAAQHGVVARWQLIERGCKRRRDPPAGPGGTAAPMYRGVYAVGNPNPHRQAWLLAAVVCFGAIGPFSATAPQGRNGTCARGRASPRSQLPRSAEPILRSSFTRSPLPADERTVHDGIPITTVPRTLLDLATVLDHDALVRALNEAEAGRLAAPSPYRPPRAAPRRARHRRSAAGARRRGVRPRRHPRGARGALRRLHRATTCRRRSSTLRSAPATAPTSPTPSGPSRA